MTAAGAYDDRDELVAARQAALGLVTAKLNGISEVTLPMMTDWLDRDLRPCRRTQLLGEQLLYWSGLLFRLACAGAGLDADVATLVIPVAETLPVKDVCELSAAVVAASRQHWPLCSAILAFRLASRPEPEDAVKFLGLLVEVATLIAVEAARYRSDNDSSALLANLGLDVATRSYATPDA